MEINKLIIVFLFFMLSLMIHTEVMGQYRLIQFNIKSINSNCGTGFQIDDKIESNEQRKVLLKKILYKSLIDYKLCDSIPNYIYKTKGYKKMVLHVYTDTAFSNYSMYDYKNRWVESYMNLLNFNTDNKSLLSVSNDLLKFSIDDGIGALINKDLSEQVVKMRRLKKYINLNKKDFYRMSLIAIVYHNIGEFHRRDQLLEEFKIEQKEDLYKLFKKVKKINYIEYLQTVFGGV